MEHAPPARTRTRHLREWLTADRQHVVRVERKNNGQGYRLVVAPAPGGGKVDWTADWTVIGWFGTAEMAIGWVSLLIAIN